MVENEHECGPLHIMLEEYRILKMEQLERIKTRDNMIYLSLGVFGAIFSFVLFQQKAGYIEISRSMMLLALPIVSFVLSWVYVNNDEKVSQIGKYIREKLKPAIKNEIKKTDIIIFGWENYHRSDIKRKLRKKLQVITDVVAFIVPPVLGLVLYVVLVDKIMYTYLVFYTILLIMTFLLLFLFDSSERGKDKKE